MVDGNQAWGGRFKQATVATVVEMNASIGFDAALALEDIAGSVAHSRMLAAQDLITADEQREIEAGLVAIAAEIRAGAFEFTVEREDVHMNIEGALADRLGRVAGRLHTGRSRNDQVALDLRLWLRRELTGLGHELHALVTMLLTSSVDHCDVVMPGYTHLQRAQPVTFGHHMSAYAAMFLRDIDRLCDARRRASVLPLGSGALAATPLPLDRRYVARELEFDEITLNSLDGVSDRDAGIETLAALSIVMVHVSRLAEELVLWTSQEFGFIELADGYCTGSSLMPQKKNPDIPELLRGKSGRVFGDLQALLTVMKGLPLAYNKDMQEDKEPLFDAMATVRSCIRILPDLLNTASIKPERMRAATRDGFLLATDLADYLVDKQVPFREAHHVVGSVVAYCIANNKRLEELDISELAALHEAFEPDVLQTLDVELSVARRNLIGGPAPAQVRHAAAEMTRAADGLLNALKSGGPSAIELALASGSALPAPATAKG